MTAPGFTSQELRDDRQAIERHREVDDRINLALIQGDLSRLSEKEKRDYYLATCKSLGLNPLTKPFEYLKLNGREILYARKDCTEQLRKLQRISLTILSRDVAEGIYVVTARAVMPGNMTMGGMYGDRTDEDIGAVVIKGLQGEPLANAMMKATTKAKRRVTLSICGLGMLDETEVEDIPGAQRVDHETGEITPGMIGPKGSRLTPTGRVRMNEEGEPEVEVHVQPPKRDTAPAPEPPEHTEHREAHYRQRAIEIAATTTLTELAKLWKAISSDRRNGNLTIDGHNRLLVAKDQRKAELTLEAVNRDPINVPLDDAQEPTL